MSRTFSKYFAVIWLSAILFLVTSCSNGNQGTGTSAVDIYRAAAQEFIDAGDYDSAIQALEEGIAATGNESLVALLEEVKNAQAAQVSEDDTEQEETQPPANDNIETTDEPEEPTNKVTEPADTDTPSITPSPESPPAAVGQFDHLVGTWQDEYGAGYYLCIGYSDASKQHAYAHLYAVVDFEVELVLGEGLEGEESAYGYVGEGSVPDYAINLYPDKWWLEAAIEYLAEDTSDYLKFYPADMDANPPTNPYYTG